MITSFRHKGLKDLFESGSVRGVNPQWKKRLLVRLEVLDSAQRLEDIDVPGWNLHELKGQRARTWSIDVTGNYRMTFEIVPQDSAGETEASFDVCNLDLEDYH